MAQVYEVNYSINVLSQQAVQALNQFKAAVTSLNKTASQFTNIERRIRNLGQTMSSFGKTRYIDIRIKGTSISQINKRIAAIERLNTALAVNSGRESVLNGGIINNKGARSSARSASSTSASSKSTRSSSPQPAKARPVASRVVAYPSVPSNIGYKLLGPTPLPNNGGMSIDMLQGMGIAYGISGLGTLVSNVVSQAAEYDNLTTTVENILKSHDSKGNFSQRFNNMQQVIRNVGMETKYKATEVADAAKFLAMAGLDVESIQSSIRPIADIALVGDTELGETADLVTNIMTAYNISPERMRNAADVMTNTFTMSNTTLTEIAEAYKYSASLLSAGGVSFEEATSAIGVLGDAGIKGSQAGTTLRTIMANLANPTKKQKSAWDSIGVSATDSNGNVRSLIDVFKDLNKKNLGVSDFYRLFHKTAASGAAALALHVSKWDDVFVENFMSGGLSKKLADKKKNTIQGLWAKLTSVFTDQGIKSFGNVDSAIRDILQNIINWLKTDEAKNAINNLAKDMMEFVHIMIDATKTFYKFFQAFAPILKTWIKFQLYITPVVKAFTALRMVSLSLGGLRLLGANIKMLAGSFGILKTTATAAGTSMAATMGMVHNPYGLATGSTFLSALSWKQQALAGKGLSLNRPHAYIPYGNDPLTLEYANIVNKQNFDEYKKDRKKYQRRILGRQALAGAGAFGKQALVGGLMYYGMDQAISEDGSSVAGALYGAAGLSAEIGGPWGWAAAGALALTGLAFQIKQAVDVAEESGNKLKKIFSDFSFKEGVLVDNNATGITKYLQTVRQNNHDINDELDLRIKKTRELLGLENPDKAEEMGVTTDTYKKIFELMNKGGKFTSESPLLETAEDLTKLKDLTHLDIASIIKTGRRQLTIDGVSSDKYLSYTAMAGNLAIAEEALKGKYAKQVNEDFAQRQMKAILNNSPEALKKNREDFIAQFGASTWSKVDYHKDWSEEQWKFFADDQQGMKLNGLFQRILFNQLSRFYGDNNGAENAMTSFHSALRGNTTDLTNKFTNLYQYMGDSGLLMSNYGTPEWWNANGWNGTTFIPKGDNANEIDQARVVLKQVEEVKTMMARLGLDNVDNAGIKAMLQDIETLRKNAEGYLALTGGEPLPKNWSIPDGMTIPLNGAYYKYNPKNDTWVQQETAQVQSAVQNAVNTYFSNGIPQLNTTAYNWGTSYGSSFTKNFNFGFNSSFTPSVGNGGSSWTPIWQQPTTQKKEQQLGPYYPNNTQGVTTPAIVISNKDMQKQLAKQSGSKNTSTPSRISSPSPVSKSTSPDPYKSHYQNGNAAPKQIIVRIGNLMKVDKIDMADPSKRAAVVNNLKSELAAALIDVVADFDESMG